MSTESGAIQLIGQSAVSKVERGAQRLDLVELHRWLSAIGAPTVTAFVQAFEKRVGEQSAAEMRWLRTRAPTGKTTTPQPTRARKRST